MNFEHIRPYDDSEVVAAIARLLADEEFIMAIGEFRFPALPAPLRKLLKPLIRYALSREMGRLKTVRDIQKTCEVYLDKIISATTTGLSYSGLEKLERDKAYLFISNHRDIVMDPAFVNYALYHSGLDTVRIAIGDNLLQKPFVSDLMRLNKSFIVKRSATGVREKMSAYMSLSSYIQHSIAENCPIWIAQREGRAKDGIDQTEPAIIKMLYMSQKANHKQSEGKTPDAAAEPKSEQLDFSAYINWLNIVPVTISYEYNPCDRLIAKELYQRQTTGSYSKAPGEDLRSIVMGITGQKGKVHIAFGERLEGHLPTAEAVAARIDEQMLRNYALHPSAHIAAALLAQEDIPEFISRAKVEEFLTRLVDCGPEREQLLQLYANPLRRQSFASPTFARPTDIR